MVLTWSFILLPLLELWGLCDTWYWFSPSVLTARSIQFPVKSWSVTSIGFQDNPCPLLSSIINKLHSSAPLYKRPVRSCLFACNVILGMRKVWEMSRVKGNKVKGELVMLGFLRMWSGCCQCFFFVLWSYDVLLHTWLRRKWWTCSVSPAGGRSNLPGSFWWLRFEFSVWYKCGIAWKAYWLNNLSCFVFLFFFLLLDHSCPVSRWDEKNHFDQAWDCCGFFEEGVKHTRLFF